MSSTLDTRLAALPRKTGVPFRELLAAGQLSEDDASVILDAGELAGEHHRLLAFAIGYLTLRGQGVPLHDVIRMAKAQGRRVNLAWSAKRWTDEHDRLSRAEALAALTRDNVTYDLAKFAKHLPPRFPGYLIGTSRRLGMEGLRQRHCVASYHDRLLAGSCAIVVVFENRQRWTVELVTTGDTAAPLRIAQIRTRFNERPFKMTTDRIHALLGITVPVPKHAIVEEPREHAYMENLRHLLPLLREHAVMRVHVSFDGAGDSGSIDNVSYDAPAGFDATTLTLERSVFSAQFDDGRWIRTPALEQASVQDTIEDLTSDYLEETGVNWYDNDGGFGTLVIDVNAGTVSLDVEVRYTESTNEFSSERDILSGEEV